MDRTPIKKSIRRLREARDSLPNLRELQTSFMADDFEQAWFVFLGALNSVPEILKTGCKTDPTARQWWFGQKEPVIRGDPLLRYLLHSRGGDFHGPERITVMRTSVGTPEDPEVGLEGPRPVHGSLHVPDHVKSFRMWYELQPVHDNSGNTFAPPQEHLGYKILDSSPCGIAALAMRYYEELIREAEAFAA